jgi:aspartyl-tRNA(Asn)/glutamyl-tRNA(Gln) amidotransferase subunit A
VTNQGDVRQLLAGFAAGELTPGEAVDRCFDRFAALDPQVNASVVLLHERAANAAKEATRRWRTGTARPLEGVPFAVKDVIDVAGVATTAGSAALAGNIARDDADAVRLLCSQGAIPVAKVHTSPFAFGDPSGADFGVTRNPHDPTRIAGTSSSGPGAAVAGGAVPLALGTDTAGSVRIPAAHCGVAGFKPTFGAVPMGGVLPSTGSLDHVGVIGSSVIGVRLATEALGGPGGPAAGPARVGVLRGRFTELCTEPDAEAYADAVDLLDGLATSCEELDWPLLAETEDVAFTIAAVEIARSMTRLPGLGGRLPGLSGSLREFLHRGQATPAADYAYSAQLRAELVRRAEAVDVDFVVLPAVQCVAPPVSTLAADVATGTLPWLEVAARNTMPFNVLGWPAISVPAGSGEHGLPVGLQIAAKPGQDAALLELAARFQDRSAE